MYESTVWTCLLEVKEILKALGDGYRKFLRGEGEKSVVSSSSNFEIFDPDP